MKNSKIFKSEARIQQDIVRWYRNAFCLSHHSHRCLILSIPNEGNPRLSQIGALRGASDLLVVHRHKSENYLQEGITTRVIWVEIKTPIGRQSPKQRAFQQQVEDMGFPYHIVRSLEEFQKLVNTWIARK